MKCPVCETVDLHITDRHGVEVDYCPKCRGLWLDRGEVDRIIERATKFEQDFPASRRKSKRDYDDYYHEDEYDDVHDHHDRDYRSDKKRRRNRKKDFLEEIFDIFD